MNQETTSATVAYGTIVVHAYLVSDDHFRMSMQSMKKDKWILLSAKSES